MNTRLTLPLLVIFLVTCLARSVSVESSFEQIPLSQVDSSSQKQMVWLCYESKTDTPWLLVKNQTTPDGTRTPYYGGFELPSPKKNNVLLQRLYATCPHNKNRCTTFYIAQARGFTAPRAAIKGKNYEWVKIHDITTSLNQDHGVWAQTKGNNKVLICPMLVNALKNSSKIS